MPIYQTIQPVRRSVLPSGACQPMSTIGKSTVKDSPVSLSSTTSRKPTSDDLWQTGFHADPSGRIKFWEDQEGEQIIGTERECVLKKQLADCPALAPLSFADAKKEMNLTQREEVKFLIGYGDKEAFKEWRRDIRNPIDKIVPGDFEDANNDQAQRAVQFMGLNLAQLLEYNRVTFGDIASLGGMIRREHYPAIAMLIKRLESGDELSPKTSYDPVSDALALFEYSCNNLPAMAWFLLHNAPSLMTLGHHALRSAYEAGSFPLAKALIAKGMRPGDDDSLYPLKVNPNPSLISKLMGIKVFRLSSAPKKILESLTPKLNYYQQYDNHNANAAVESINALYQRKPKIFQENITKSAELLLCCLKHSSKHAEAMNATRALAKTILSSFDGPKTTAEQTELMSSMSDWIMRGKHDFNLHLADEALLNTLDKSIAERDYSFPHVSALNAEMAITFFKKNDSRYKNYLRYSKDSERLWKIAFHEQIPEFTEEAMTYLPRVSLHLSELHQAALERTNSVVANHLCLAFEYDRLDGVDLSQAITSRALPPERVAEIKTSPQEAHQLACFLVEQCVEPLGFVLYCCLRGSSTLGKALIELPASCPVLLNESRRTCWVCLMNYLDVPLRKDIISRLVAECDAAGKSLEDKVFILKVMSDLITIGKDEIDPWCKQIMSDCRDSEKSCSATPEM